MHPLVHHSNASTYTLTTIHSRSDLSSLITPLSTPSYGATFPRSPTLPPSRKLLLNAAVKMASIFLVSAFILGGTLYLALPTLEE